MSTYYDFMVEAKYEGKWYNIDFHTKDIDGKLRHQYLATISRSFIGLLEDRVNGAWAISFDDLAESTQQLLLASTFEGREDSLRLERFYVAGNLDDFERLLNGPYQMEYYVTRNQIEAGRPFSLRRRGSTSTLTTSSLVWFVALVKQFLSMAYVRRLCLRVLLK